MSHACCIVALSPEDLQRAGGNIEAAVSYQMLPFDENGEWFKDGSRWDWWVIGGRYTGKFSPPDYDPHTDPANMETCFLCDGTGMRMDQLGIEHRKQYPDYKCNGCGGTGKSLKHPGHWREIGNTVLRKDINLEALTKKVELRVRKMWAEYQALESPNKGRIYGIKEGDTEESLVAAAITKPLTAYTFLRNRCWNECERLGWFGSGAKTECEIKAEEQGKEYVGRCICEKEGAKIITWSGPKDSEELWGKMYYRRFIQELPDDTLLVVVDYHV